MPHVLEVLKKIIANELKCKPEELSADSAVGDVAGWDSLGHVRVLLAVEAHFGLTFTLDENLEMESLQDIIDVLEDKGVVNS